MLAETIMRQILFGESRGVGIIRTFQGQFNEAVANPRLEHELGAQIADESRHARSYARMLARRSGANVGSTGVDAGWKTIILHLSTAKSFSTTLIGIYGLMEPFNLLSIQTFLLPLLKKGELAEVDQIAKDEARHIGMFELFSELVERRALRVDEAECLAMIRVFSDALKDGIGLPSGERIVLPRNEWRAFMSHIARLKDRIVAWSDAPASRSLLAGVPEGA
jgi:hypothetical protein